jgi:hypothetical protein
MQPPTTGGYGGQLCRQVCKMECQEATTTQQVQGMSCTDACANGCIEKCQDSSGNIDDNCMFKCKMECRQRCEVNQPFQQMNVQVYKPCPFRCANKYDAQKEGCGILEEYGCPSGSVCAKCGEPTQQQPTSRDECEQQGLKKVCYKILENGMTVKKCKCMNPCSDGSMPSCGMVSNADGSYREDCKCPEYNQQPGTGTETTTTETTTPTESGGGGAASNETASGGTGGGTSEPTTSSGGGGGASNETSSGG